MSVLNLDEKACPLCVNVIHCFQSVNLNAFRKKMKLSEVYKLLYSLYKKEQKLLSMQGLKTVDITLEQIIQHFESHEIDLHSSIYSDLHTTRCLQQSVMDSMYKEDGSIDHKAVKTCSNLSIHKVILFQKLEKECTEYEALVPYSFN